MNWREAAFFLIVVIILTILATRGDAQDEPPPLVQCAQGQCLISVAELRMLVQRASLCGWEAK